MKHCDIERATAIVIAIDSNIITLEYIDATRPELLGQHKTVSIDEVPECSRWIYCPVTVTFSSTPLNRSRYTKSDLLFNQGNERLIVSIS